MPSGYRKDRVSGSVSEPRSTFSQQPATQRYNPALVPNSSSDRNGLMHARRVSHASRRPPDVILRRSFTRPENEAINEPSISAFYRLHHSPTFQLYIEQRSMIYLYIYLSATGCFTATVSQVGFLIGSCSLSLA